MDFVSVPLCCIFLATRILSASIAYKQQQQQNKTIAVFVMKLLNNLTVLFTYSATKMKSCKKCWLNLLDRDPAKKIQYLFIYIYLFFDHLEYKTGLYVHGILVYMNIVWHYYFSEY